MSTPDGLPQWWSQIDDTDLSPPDATWQGALDAAFDDGRDVDYDLYDTPAEITGEAVDDQDDHLAGDEFDAAVDTEPDSHSFDSEFCDDDTVIELVDFSDDGGQGHC
ncbi:hypothetical protein GII33_18150 [Gordonia pseudamarae]|jgi:hypothetical protein|uniref:DUF5709 domain-containing protein n=1 Tax=Gordonia pseudamarae TaxID=2831662 RepID=A0ABX6IKP4_9ACTN|nr:MULTISPECIES: hypothetical protein [Gordonia]MBD0021241.1 hypothetical protein [Gordonia sp. (in: high G+C Gram-positive bacteria)]QHN27605.1 hypothetical protein GII33_18150 [Gordonia pseudamarae]QHN36487.1 hypothetical protein GII31_17925 [Gordonia pseudamarae]